MLKGPEPVKAIQAIPVSSQVMRISWRDTKGSMSVPVTYHVYHSVHNQLKYCGNTTEKFINCGQLKPHKKYEFYVRRNDEAINATVKNFTMEDSKYIVLYQIVSFLAKQILCTLDLHLP